MTGFPDPDHRMSGKIVTIRLALRTVGLLPAVRRAGPD